MSGKTQNIAQSTPISPPSGPTHWLFQGPPAESKLLAEDLDRMVGKLKSQLNQALEEIVCLSSGASVPNDNTPTDS
jgi:hypothetical protein